MTAQLDAILAAHDDGCPTSREFKRALVIELRRTLVERQGVLLRRRGRR